MEPYLFHGIVLPERAQLSLGFSVKFDHIATKVKAEAQVSIVFNQVAVWVTSDHEWNIFDLRNVVKNLVQGHLAMIGYLKGYAYDIEITRVLSRERGIDYVFGIDIPCIANRNQDIELNEALLQLRQKTTGEHGVFLHRCFDDLVSAMKHADDTGFYCYRAIESLRHHYAARTGLREVAKNQQWQAFRDFSGVDEKSIRVIKAAADPLRHGEPGTEASDRAELFTTTWA
ncbi:hypothetical protein [Undibacterium aquatile]|uniref:hypothetical protein n=1 Tax=Undibacterium aquatile TaxID=1537398 RepID=UPI001CC24BA2|nr:hypothetical protein [Undibacterium aquatile]